MYSIWLGTNRTTFLCVNRNAHHVQHGNQNAKTRNRTTQKTKK